MTRSEANGYSPLPPDHPDFEDLSSLEGDIFARVGGQAEFQNRVRSMIRSAIDEVIDPLRTGRRLFDELEKTEKTYLGTKVELRLRALCRADRGSRLDMKIGSREVDVKLTTSGRHNWMIPQEAIEQFCLLLHVDDEEFVCSAGLVRARKGYLRESENRDRKTSFSASGVKNIWWLMSGAPYEANFWSRVDSQTQERIAATAGGTKKLVIFFESCIGLSISRDRVAAIAPQDDFMKRIRKNGGARDPLARKGIAILYSEKDRDLIQRLGLTVGHREFVSYRPANAQQERWLREAGRLP